MKGTANAAVYRRRDRGFPQDEKGFFAGLERDDFSSIRHLALSFCLSMIFSENRCPLFRIMLKSRLRALQEKTIRKIPYISGVVENAHCNA